MALKKYKISEEDIEAISYGNLTVKDCASKYGCGLCVIYDELKKRDIRYTNKFYKCPVCGKTFYIDDLVVEWSWMYERKKVCGYNCMNKAYNQSNKRRNRSVFKNG